MDNLRCPPIHRSDSELVDEHQLAQVFDGCWITEADDPFRMIAAWNASLPLSPPMVPIPPRPPRSPFNLAQVREWVR